jgi:UDP-N-acetylglucosamine diphosphorylase/glucosamine-1-phosphate N-acetyltransferase
MALKTIFFEDDHLKNFHPLTLTRPLYDLRIGILTLGQKWNSDLNAEGDPCGPLRNTLIGLFDEPHKINSNETLYWINSRVFPDQPLVEAIKSLKPNNVLKDEKAILAAHIDSDIHENWLENGMDIKMTDTVEYDSPCKALEDIWQIFQLNGSEIKRDIERVKRNSFVSPDQFPHSVLVNTDQIFIEEGAIVEPGAILYADEGPIYIGKDARIMANSIVRGPAAICEKSIIKMGAKIYKDTTIGPVCKVGGEVSNVVFHSYSNKAHDGYAGNSVFGQWCNIGADTNTSNLKNNYSTVRFRNWATGEEVDTGQQFIGTIMGDHSKTGINAMLNTGTLCGVCCNLFSDGYPPKYIPSFSWVSGKDVVPYHFEKAVEAMEKMMERRNVALTPAYKNMMYTIFKSTL